MTKEELAAMLDGRRYGKEISKKEESAAKESGLVVVYGASGDLMIFGGYISDEFDCWRGGAAYLNETGLLTGKCDNEDCPYFDKYKEKAKAIKALWGTETYGYDICWTYETDIPHSEFKIMDGEEIYCIGIVFNMNDLK